ncbi:EAL domain-containing protein [Halomonas vilamensis]|uniref:EAL domain-containing protein n=1 Tax=Vreelandella vilamensis TaxID=531309 RepID=A0ABU1H7M6_9GAMM|nr:EAL domain-containing protein [Halomonas vilamensis]MDR5900115.1 EAL domain-containing protein [Halomonas vilamensis]
MAFSDKTSILEVAIEQSDSPVVLTTAELDPPGPEIVYVNEAFTRLTGYTRDELVGATPRIHQGPATERTELDRLKATLRNGDTFEGRTWNYRKDGTAYQVAWTVSPLRLASEGTDYFFSVQRDVTEFYEIQEALTSETRRLNSLLQSSGGDHDPVTGVLNYRGMLMQLQRLLGETVSADSVVGLIKLQCQRLERIDQAYGVKATNRLLNDIRERLGAQLEPSEFLVRSHEHTFAVLAPVTTETADKADQHLLVRARALVAAIMTDAFNVGDSIVEVEVGVGIARAPVDSHDPSELSVYAEEAAQRSANTNAGQVHWADHQTLAAQRKQLALENKLRRAIRDGDLTVVYQPIVALDSSAIVGAEALARWPQPAGDAAIGPAEFIPLAETLGLMDCLGTQVFEQACRQLRHWQQRPGNEAFWVSVNVAPAQLGNPNLANEFVAITRAANVSPAYVKLEITESALEQGVDEVNDVIESLKTAGFPLALDDFGMGHSSLRRLIDMPFSVLKVDRSFVWETPDGRGAGVVSSLSQLSRHLKLDALGEGVETAAHEAFLRECDYTYAQGYYYSKPVAADDFPLF